MGIEDLLSKFTDYLGGLKNVKSRLQVWAVGTAFFSLISLQQGCLNGIQNSVYQNGQFVST